MAWLAENWVWVLIGIAFVAMHLFGHGGRGRDEGQSLRPRNENETDQPGQHRH